MSNYEEHVKNAINAMRIGLSTFVVNGDLRIIWGHEYISIPNAINDEDDDSEFSVKRMYGIQVLHSMILRNIAAILRGEETFRARLGENGSWIDVPVYIPPEPRTFTYQEIKW